jgi:hypothetical protein
MNHILNGTISLAMSLLLGQSSARSQEKLQVNHAEAAPVMPYPNSTEGLRHLLQHLMAAAKSGDAGTVTTAIRGMEIPDYHNWFVDTFGKETGEAWAQPYSKELRDNETHLQALLMQLAQKDGEIFVARVDSYAKPGSLEWGLSHGLKRPADFYLAEFRSPEGPKSAGHDFLGYFVFVDGRFCWDSTIHQMNLLSIERVSGVATLRPIPTQGDGGADSGTVYESERSKFRLTVPSDWRFNDDLARAQYGIGAFTSPGDTVNLLVQQMPSGSGPAEFAKQLDAQGDRLFADYRKIGESHLTLDGKDCEAISFQFSDKQKAAESLGTGVPLQSYVVIVPVQWGILVLNFVTSSQFFDAEQPIFSKIVASYRSTPGTLFVPSPEPNRK